MVTQTAWIRALTNRAYKICSDAQLLSQEIYNIRKFMPWNGFSEKLSLQLIKNFAPKQYTQNNVSFEEQNDNLPKIWISLPFIGKHGTNLIRKFKRKVLPLLKIQCKFIVNWDTTTTNTFVSKKDKTPKKFLSSVVYKFSCPGCSHSYIGIRQTDASIQDLKNTPRPQTRKSSNTSTVVNTLAI